MADFIDTPAGAKFLACLTGIAEIFRHELGAGCTVSPVTMRGGMGLGAYPGLRVQAKRTTPSKFWADLDVFLHWPVAEVVGFANASEDTREQSLDALRASSHAQLKAALNSGSVDLKTYSQGPHESVWIELHGLYVTRDGQKPPDDVR